MTDIKFPEVVVELIGQDGNAFAIMGQVTKAMRRAGISPVHIDEYRTKAMSGDYNHLLQVTFQTVTVE